VVAKCKYLTTQHVSQTASVIEVSASLIPTVSSVRVYAQMGKASDSINTKMRLVLNLVQLIQDFLD
jgi:hypothetical protein